MFVRNKIYVGQRTGTCRFDTQIKTETAANDLTRGKTESGHEKGACLFMAESELTLKEALKD